MIIVAKLLSTGLPSLGLPRPRSRKIFRLNFVISSSLLEYAYGKRCFTSSKIPSTLDLATLIESLPHAVDSDGHSICVPISSEWSHSP